MPFQPTSILHPRRWRAGGFSLAEVTIAVGITALGIVALLGLMPQGLDMARRTTEIAAEARILQQLTNELQQEQWTNLDTYNSTGQGGSRFYDDQGIEVTTNRSFLSYVVRIEVPEANVVLPTNGTTQTEFYLRRVIIKIAATNQEGFDFTEANRRNFRTFPVLIANTNQ